MNVNALFSTPVGVKDIPIDTSKMLKTCLEIEKNDNRAYDSSKEEDKTIYTSHPDADAEHSGYILEHPDFSMLKSVITSEVKVFTRMVGIESRGLELNRSWFTIQKKHSTISQHNHRHGVISGAFYVYADEDAAPITFASPLMSYKMNEPRSGVSGTADVNFADEYFSVAAKTGKLVLFPSWLEHYVGYNISDCRIVISFNFS